MKIRTLTWQRIKKGVFIVASLYLVAWTAVPNAYALMPAADKMNFKYGGGFYSAYCGPSTSNSSVAAGNLQEGMWVTGTVYSGENGAYAANLANQPASFAELKGANGINGKQQTNEDKVWGTGLGKLPAHTKLMIAYNNKYVIAEKLDIGDGIYTHDEMKVSDFVGDKMPGHAGTDLPRLVDLYLPTTGKMLGITGTVPIFIKAVAADTPSTPANGSAADFEGTPSSSTNSSSTSASTTTTTPKDATSKRTIVLDPGHAGVNSRNQKLLDPATKLYIGESNNGQENQDAWDVAQTVKKGLEKDGYTVILTKDDPYDKNVTLKSRAEIANNAKADLAVSIHTSSGKFDTGSVNTVTPQTTDSSLDYRTNTDDKDIHFTSLHSDAATIAKKSLEYANKIVKARNANGSSGARIGYLDFNGRGSKKAPMSQGRMSITQLFANVPWVYNEAGQSGLDKAAYAKGLLEGIESAVPITQSSGDTQSSTTTTTNGDGCTTTTFNADASDATLISLIQAYVWTDPNHKPTSRQLPAYKSAIAKAHAAGKYIGGDGGNDCGGFVTRLMQDSGRDPNYGGHGPTSTQMAYLKKHTELYKQVSFSDLKFGDIGIFNGHTFMYIGKDVPGFKYPIVEAAYRGDDGRESSAPRNINAGAYDYRSDTLYFRYIGGANASQNI